MPDPDFLGPAHLGAVFLIKRPHLFFVGLIDLGQYCEHLLRRQITAGVLDIGSLIETGIFQTPGEHLRATHGLAGLFDLVLHRGIADHYPALERFLPKQLLVDQRVQRRLAQLFVGAGTADAGDRTALILQVFGEIALQAQLGYFLAIDPGHGRAIAAKRGGHPQGQQHQYSREFHLRPPDQGMAAMGL
ncbi:hypothetical protein D3C76_1099720 [compost metagenome]